MAIHDQKFKEYQSYPGRQIEYVVVPRRYPHYFFEGVQSVDATANSDEVNHGQFGFKSDVIIDRDYSNTTGTVSLKEFNNASYVLRGMTGADPTTSFIFDPSRFEHVDVCANVYNKARNKVIRSSWFVDFTPSLSENESLDDIQTKDLSYTAIRKIDFEGYQIVHQEFLTTIKGDQDFQLRYPAVVDPVVAYAKEDDSSTEAQTAGLIVGKGRHDLCPIQYMLRVIVDGEVLDDPTQATVITTVNGESIQSTLHLTSPLEDDDIPVIAFWLSDGEHPYGATAVTSAPVMSAVIFDDYDIANNAEVYEFLDWDTTANSGQGGFVTPVGSATQSGKVKLIWSESLNGSVRTSLHESSGTPVTFDNFELRYTITDNATGLLVVPNGDIGSPTEIGGVAAGSSTPIEFDSGVITRNQLTLTFDSTKFDALVTTLSSASSPYTIDWYLTYQAAGGLLPVKGEDTKEVTPVHTIHFQSGSMGRSVRVFD